MWTDNTARLKTAALFVLTLLFTGCAATQQSTQPEESSSGTRFSESPPSIYQPINTPDSFNQAVQNGTRSRSGNPGPNYWQQHARYDLDARIYPSQKKLKGHGTVVYYNNSPDTLRQLYMELALNIHKEGVVRNVSQEITGGVHLNDISVDGTKLKENAQNGPSWHVSNTLLRLNSGEAVAPGDSARINISWWFKIPSKGASGRMGYDKDNLFYIGYWYPKMAVYDDVNGWYRKPFKGNAEFYYGYADYSYDVTMPSQWVLMGSGTLQNRADVLAPRIAERLRKAEQSDEVVHIITPDDFGRATTGDSLLTWSFKAQNVRDVAFSATRESKWDAVRIDVGDRDGDGSPEYARGDAFYRTSATYWDDAADYVRHSIHFHSGFTGFNYPWSHMTAVEGAGIIGGGMEYPMMTVIGSYNDETSENLYNVIAHELAHMWEPMIVGSNERRYAWQDEGTTTFNENEARDDRFESNNHYRGNQQSYIQFAGSDTEGPMMRWSDYHYNGYAYIVASYYKPASVLVALRNVLGNEAFKQAYHEYFKRWAYKNPTPWDMFNTFEDVTNRDLDWFWRSWYYETWTLDQSLKYVTPRDKQLRIVVENKGKIPMPVNLTLHLDNGDTLHKSIPVSRWLNGNQTATLMIDRPDSPVEKVVIDEDKKFPDINRSNNSWSKTPPSR